MTASPAEGTVPGPVYDFDGTKTTRTYRTGYKMANVSDIPSAYVRRMAVEDIIEISRLQFKVLTEEKYDFKQAAKDFKVRDAVCCGSPEPTRPATRWANVGRRLLLMS